MSRNLFETRLRQQISQLVVVHLHHRDVNQLRSLLDEVDCCPQSNVLVRCRAQERTFLDHAGGIGAEIEHAEGFGRPLILDALSNHLLIEFCSECRPIDRHGP